MTIKNAAACCALLGAVVIAWTWPLALHPATQVALPDRLQGHWREIVANDQLLTIFGVAHNARAVLSGDFSALIDHGLCWPTPDAAFLGEHMIEAGLLGVPGYLISGDPVVAYNLACLLSIVIAGVSMFAFVCHHGLSPGAALVSALLFALAPARLDNLSHLAVQGTHWIPLVLLAFDRLLERRRPRDAAALSLVAVLACLTGSYPLMTLVLFGGGYAVLRLAARRGCVDYRFLLLACAAVTVVSILIYALLSPYLEAQATWRLFWQRGTRLASYASLVPGGSRGTGLLALVLAAVGAGRARSGVWAALAGGLLLCLLASTEGPLWPGGPSVPSLYSLLARYVEPLQYVRVPAALIAGVVLGLSAMAGLGADRIVVLAGRRGPTLARTAAASLALLVLLEVFWSPLAQATYGRTVGVALADVAPRPGELELYRDAGGPILDLPYHDDFRRGVLREMPSYVFLAAYHGRSVAACYNSYKPPSQQNAARLAGRLLEDRGRALAEIAAAGFASLVVHPDMPGAEEYAGLDGPLPPAPPTTSEVGRLTPGLIRVPLVWRPARSAQFASLPVTNRSAAMWTAARPVVPVKAVVRFLPAGAGVLRENKRAIMLPLALAAGATDSVPVPVDPLPPPGIYDVELSVPELGWNLRADHRVRVVSARAVKP